jgi:hypothetical protein
MILNYHKSKPDYMCIPEIDSPLADIIQPNLETGPWIAGGAALQWFQGLPVKSHDVDVFFRDTEQYEALYDNIIHVRGYTKHFSQVKLFVSENAETFRVYLDTTDKQQKQQEWKVQLIKHFVPNVNDLLKRFDISVCKIATDCKKFKIMPGTVQDIYNKRLRFPQGMKPDSLKRLIKYYGYGYKPDPELWQKVFEVEGAITNFKQDHGEYNNAI